MKFFKVVAFRSQKSDEFLFSLQGKTPRRLKYLWDKYILWGGVSSLSLVTALDGTANWHL